MHAKHRVKLLIFEILVKTQMFDSEIYIFFQKT
jgi:hypothetical protein